MSATFISTYSDAIDWLDAQPREYIWSCFVRGVSLIYAWALIILGGQTNAIPAAQGIMPLKARFERIRTDFPRPWRWIYFPSWLHLCHADWFLSTFLFSAAISGLALVWFGVGSRLGIFIMWSTYLSYANLMNFMYPWDCLILETGFLTLLMPNLSSGFAAATFTSELRPLLLFSFRLLIWRLMFGFGKFKFIGMKFTDLSYLQGFLINQPLPTVLGWFMAKLPLSVHIFSYAFLFFVEIPGPFLYFFCGWPRLLGFILVNMLQVGINLTGTFGFFNLLTAFLSVSLLDLQGDVFSDFVWSREMGDWSGIAFNSFLCFLFCLHLVYLPFNSWCSQAFLAWPCLNYPAGLFGKFVRLVQPFHLSHAYGVFFPHSSPNIKWIPLIEGTSDEVLDETGSETEKKEAKAAGAVPENQAVWETYTYKFIISDPYLTPRFVAPYHPRMEHAILYEALGLGPQTHLAPLTTSDPYEFQDTHMLQSVCQGLLRENIAVEKLFRARPFGKLSSNGKRLRAIRVSMYVFRPTSIVTLWKTGRWYDRYYSHIHIPLITLRSIENGRRGLIHLNEPELWHPESILNQERTPVIQRLLSKLEVKSATDQLTSALAAHTATELADLFAFDSVRPHNTPVNAFAYQPILPEDVTRFWTNFVTPIQSSIAKVRISPAHATTIHALQNGSRAIGLKDDVLIQPKNRPFLVDKPWNEADPGQWSRIIDQEVMAKAPWVNFTKTEKKVYEKVLARLTLLLMKRLFPYYHGPSTDEPTRTVWSDLHGTSPISSRLSCPNSSHLHLPSFYHFYIYCHHIIGHGEAAYNSVLGAPDTGVNYLNSYCLESSLFFFGLFHHDILAYQSRKRRLISIFSHPSAMVSGGVLPGFLGIYYHFLEHQFPTPSDSFPKLKAPESMWEGWTVTIGSMPSYSPGKQVEKYETKKMN